jgi:hypothetical protein
MRLVSTAVASLLLVAGLTGPAAAQNLQRDSIFVFGGVYSTGNISQAIIPFNKLEDSYIIGGAYRRSFLDLGLGFEMGGEVGLGARFGDRFSMEVWGGPSLRYLNIPLGSIGTLSPGFTFGLSAVTDTMGAERYRETRDNGNATLLFYLGPELAFRFHQWPNAELVWRLHHRSGLFKTLGNMEDGHNANVIGLRFYF